MATGAANNQLLISTFNKSFEKYTYDELVIGKLGKTDFQTIKKKGSQINVVMPVEVTIHTGYTGGQIATLEKVDTSIAKVFADQGYDFNFGVDDTQWEEIENCPTTESKVEKIKQYSASAYKKVAALIDKAYGQLYHRAGLYLDNSGSAISLSQDNACKILAWMATKFQRGDNNGHTAWVDGQMMAILPPEFTFYLKQTALWKETEKGIGILEKGQIGRLYGWDIYESNNIAQDASQYYYPLFGQKGQVLAGGASKNPSTEHYRPDDYFRDCYKGYGYYGVGAPRADLLGTAKVSISAPSFS